MKNPALVDLRLPEFGICSEAQRIQDDVKLTNICESLFQDLSICISVSLSSKRMTG